MALTKTEVSELYVAIFNRASEGEGNTYWQTQGDLAKVANDMLATSDAKTYFGDSLDTNQAFIEHIYLNTLNKTVDGTNGTTADADGIAYWVSLLNTGTSRGQIVADLVTAATASENAGDAQDLFNNRVNVSNYMAENVEKAPEDYKESTSFSDGLKAVTNDSTTVPIGDKIIDGLAGGNKFLLTKEIDNLVLTDASDTVIGESSSVLGTDDKIIDSSTTDHDVMNLTVSADTPAFTSLNIEEINVTLNTIGGTTIDADNITGSTITVGAAPEQEAAFTGAATVSNVGSNDVVAGNAITNLTVTDVKDGLIDTGSASQLNADTKKDTDDLNLKINGDVKLDITAGAFAELNVEVTAASVLDISDVTQAEFTKGGKITGDNDLTIKADTHTFDGTKTVKEIINEGKGALTIEFENSDEDENLSQVDSDKVITDIAFTKKIEFDGKLDVTAKATANTMTLIGPDADNGGGSEGAIVDIHLTKAATTDTFAFNQVTAATIDAQKGGLIAKIENAAIGTASDGATATKAGVADVTVKAGDDLTITDVVLDNHALVVDGASEGQKVTLTQISAAAVVANAFKGDLTMTQDGDEQIAVLGSKGDNSITLTDKSKTASVITQDGKDTIVAINEDGDLKVTTNGGDDTVSAVKMTTAKSTFDLGAGKDTLTLINIATGEATVNAGADNDTINVVTATAGTMVINGDAGNDIIDVDKANGALDNAADITVNGGAGDDVIYLHSQQDSTETITVDGGEGTDVVEVTKAADFTEAGGGVGTTLTMTTIENLKIDELAIFSNSQLNDQTFKVSSGTAGSDTLTVLVDKTTNVDSEQTTNLGDLDFSASTSTAVEYLDIDATKSLSSDKIIGGHDVTNVIDITDADGDVTHPVNNTIQLFADSIGNTIDNLQSGATQPDVTSAMLQDPHANEAKVSFDIAVITGFQTSKLDANNKVISDDSLILGDGGATATNFKSIAADDAFDGSAADKIGMEEYLANAIEDANTQLTAHSELEYVYVYDGNTTTTNPISRDAWLLWDSDGNHSVDAAILLVGVEPAAPDGTGFAASDIIAG